MISMRLPEARRRIEAIRTYMELEEPRVADAIRIGGSIGLSRSRFVRLVNAWRQHSDAKLLVLDRRNNSGPASSISPAVNAVIEAVISELGIDATLSSITEQIRDRCGSAGVEAPSQLKIWRELRKLQASGKGSSFGAPRIVVGKMWFHLPVEDQIHGGMPMALVAVMLPERLIVARRVSVKPNLQPDLSGLILDVAEQQTIGGEARPLLIERGEWRAGAPKLDVTLPGLQPHRRSLQIEISKAFGGRLGQLKATYRPLGASSAAKPKTIQARPLSEAEALEAIDGAIEANNVVAQIETPPFVISEAAAG